MAYADVKAHKAGKGALECAVYLSEFDDDETLRLLPKCSHVFHPYCIDTWLASHVTYPVCRANLVPGADDNATPADGDDALELPAAPAQESLPSPTSALAAAPATAVVIDVDETEEERIIREEADELMRIGSVKRALRSKSDRTPAQFPRSHSTGHSLAVAVSAATTGAGAGTERITLRLPDHVLRDLAAAGKLQRTRNLVAFRTSRGGNTPRGVSVRAGAAGGEGSSRAWRSIRLGQSGRWPSFLSRMFSAWLPAWGSRSTRRMVSDPVPDSSGSSGDARPRVGAGGALFVVPRLFVGFAAKRVAPSDAESSSRSPTSPLDPKALRLRSPRSPRRTWDAPGLVYALADDANCLLSPRLRLVRPHSSPPKDYGGGHSQPELGKTMSCPAPDTTSAAARDTPERYHRTSSPVLRRRPGDAPWSSATRARPYSKPLPQVRPELGELAPTARCRSGNTPPPRELAAPPVRQERCAHGKRHRHPPSLPP